MNLVLPYLDSYMFLFVWEICAWVFIDVLIRKNLWFFFFLPVLMESGNRVVGNMCLGVYPVRVGAV